MESSSSGEEWSEIYARVLTDDAFETIASLVLQERQTASPFKRDDVLRLVLKAHESKALSPLLREATQEQEVEPWDAWSQHLALYRSDSTAPWGAALTGLVEEVARRVSALSAAARAEFHAGDASDVEIQRDRLAGAELRGFSRLLSDRVELIRLDLESLCAEIDQKQDDADRLVLQRIDDARNARSLRTASIPSQGRDGDDGRSDPRASGFKIQSELFASANRSFVQVVRIAPATPFEISVEQTKIDGKLRERFRAIQGVSRTRADALWEPAQHELLRRLLDDLWESLDFAEINHAAAPAGRLTRAGAGAAVSLDFVTSGSSIVQGGSLVVDNLRRRGGRPTIHERIKLAESVVPKAFGRRRPRASRPPSTGGRWARVEMPSGRAPGEVVLPPGILEQEFDAEAGETIRSRTAQEGTEALGWYAPFHLYGPRAWGIYLDDAAILDAGLRLERDIAEHGSHVDRRLAIWSVLVFVLEHERFHARVEQAALELELTSRKGFYRRYFAGAYTRSLSSRFGALEESLAEHAAHMALLAELSSRRGREIEESSAVAIVEAMLRVSAGSPAGYRHHMKGADVQAARQLVAQLAVGSARPARRNLKQEHVLLRPASDALDLTSVPLYVTTAGPLSETFLRPRKRRDLLRLFIEAGFVETPGRGKGSHSLLRHEGSGKTFILPSGVEISAGVSAKAEAVLRMSAAEFAEARRKGRV